MLFCSSWAARFESHDRPRDRYYRYKYRQPEGLSLTMHSSVPHDSSPLAVVVFVVVLWRQSWYDRLLSGLHSCVCARACRWIAHGQWMNQWINQFDRLHGDRDSRRRHGTSMRCSCPLLFTVKHNTDGLLGQTCLRVAMRTIGRLRHLPTYNTLPTSDSLHSEN